MKTFLFTWNPNNWQWVDLPQAVYEANGEGGYLGKWSCGVTRQIHPGDRAFLMRLAVAPKGIMGSGIIVSELFEDIHWDQERAERGDKVNRVNILFDVLSDLPIIDESILTSGSLAKHNWFPVASGTRIPESIAANLEIIWSQATGKIFAPSESNDLPSLLLEGTKRSQFVTKYERDPVARKTCLRHHGTTCMVCGLLFKELYGSIGEGFIHVHHIVPLSQIGQEYAVNPIYDLRPVCPNCHAMLHKRTPPYTIAELKEIIKVSNNKI
jgi:5-methylcytosine-specific restriction enzyme A